MPEDYWRQTFPANFAELDTNELLNAENLAGHKEAADELMSIQVTMGPLIASERSCRASMRIHAAALRERGFQGVLQAEDIRLPICIYTRGTRAQAQTQKPGFQKYHSRTLWRRAVDRPRFGAGSNVGSNVGLLVQAACSLMSAFELRSGHKLLGWITCWVGVSGRVFF